MLFLFCITLSCYNLLVPQLSKSVNFGNHCCHGYHLKSVVKPTIIIIIIINWKMILRFLKKVKCYAENVKKVKIQPSKTK